MIKVTGENTLPTEEEKLKSLSNMSLEPNKAMAVSEDGVPSNQTVLTLDKEALEKGYNAPFKIVVTGEINRESLLKSVKGALKFVAKDTKLKGAFINWFCSLFHFANDVFDDEDKLTSAVDTIVDRTSRVGDIRENVVEAKPFERLSLQSVRPNADRIAV